MSHLTKRWLAERRSVRIVASEMYLQMLQPCESLFVSRHVSDDVVGNGLLSRLVKGIGCAKVTKQ